MTKKINTKVHMHKDTVSIISPKTQATISVSTAAWERITSIIHTPKKFPSISQLTIKELQDLHKASQAKTNLCLKENSKSDNWQPLFSEGFM
jgi:hypothetical protein